MACYFTRPDPMARMLRMLCALTIALKGARLYARPFERAVSPRSLTSLTSTR